MAITRLNHAVLYVRDADRSARFYTDVLGFKVRNTMTMGGGSAYFLVAPGSDNDHDLGLFTIGAQAGPSRAGAGTVGLYHLAWQVDTLDELDRLRHVLGEAGALVGASDHGVSKSLYAQDPDGIEFEVMWEVPDRTDPSVLEASTRIGHLDIDREKQRYGATTATGG